MSFTKLPTIDAGSPACLTCGCGAHETLAMDRILAVGFGSCQVSVDGKIVYAEQEIGHEEEYWRCQDAENEAVKNPEADWRISFYAALYEAEYQRQSEGHWVLVRRGEGFA